MSTRPVPSAKKGEMTVSDWFKRPEAELVVRRQDVWTLLGWYHTKVVQPQLGFAGCLRRLWWQLTGRHRKLISPWQEIHNALEYSRTVREITKRNGANPKSA